MLSLPPQFIAEIQDEIRWVIRTKSEDLRRPNETAVIALLTAATLAPFARSDQSEGKSHGISPPTQALFQTSFSSHLPILHDILRDSQKKEPLLYDFHADATHRVAQRLNNEHAPNLRQEIALLFEATGAVTTAIAAASPKVRPSLLIRLNTVTRRFPEFRWNTDQISRRATICPYKGRETFTEEDAELFFGRTALKRRLLARLPTARFLILTGEPGTGKSSFFQACVLPALDSHTAAGEKIFWRTLTCIPGNDPLQNLSRSIAALAPASEPATVQENIRSDPRALAKIATEASSRSPDHRLLLVIDQFEQIFTRSNDKATRTHFFRLLTHTMNNPTPVLTILGIIRSNNLSAFGEHPLIKRVFDPGYLTVRPFSNNDLRVLVEKPALHTGLAFEPGLVTHVLTDTSHQTAVLPFLTEALQEAWKHRGGTILSLEDYEATGGWAHRIGIAAEHVYQASGPEDQEIMRQIFLYFAQARKNAAHMQNPNQGYFSRERDHLSLWEKPQVRLADLQAACGPAEATALIVARLFNARLLTLEEDKINMAHDVILSSWKRCVSWQETERASAPASFLPPAVGSA